MISLNRRLNNRKFRIYVALFSIIQGIARVDVFNNIQTGNVSYLNNNVFGWILLILGILCLVTAFAMRKKWLGRVVAVSLATAYSALGGAIMNNMLVSALGAFLLTIFLLLEASVTHDC